MPYKPTIFRDEAGEIKEIWNEFRMYVISTFFVFLVVGCGLGLRRDTAHNRCDALQDYLGVETELVPYSIYSAECLALSNVGWVSADSFKNVFFTTDQELVPK